MPTKVEVRTAASLGEYYVEVDGPDGLKHHAGPFKSRSLAQEWIAQHPYQSESEPAHIESSSAQPKPLSPVERDGGKR